MEIPEGRRVIWSRTDRPAIETAPMALPGVIRDELPDGWALVAWLDKERWFSPDAVYETKYLAEVPDGVFENLASDLRSSDWLGLPAWI